MNVQLVQRTQQSPKATIPQQWTVSDPEKEEQKKRWANFAAYMAKPFNYTSAYVSYLRKLDAQGAINLNRVNRNQWPNVPINYLAFICFSTYEGLEAELMGAKTGNNTGVELTINAIQMADQMTQSGYRVVYFSNPTTSEYIQWYDFFLERVQKDFFIYISGYAKRFIDYTYDPAGELINLLVFYDEGRKINARGGPRKIYPDCGLTADTLSEDVLLDSIARVNRSATLRVVFLYDLYATEQIWLPNSLDPLPPNPPPRLKLPDNSILLESFVDLDSLLAQGGSTVLDVSKKTSNTSPFGAGLAKVVKAKPTAAPQTFWTVYTALVQASKATVLTALVAAKPPGLYSSIPFVPVLTPAQMEPNLALSNQIVGSSLASLTSLPPMVLSTVEIQSAQARWNQFCAEMGKPVVYASKYKAQLSQLDALGGINLDRITREQIPDVVLGRCLLLFFCPLEGFPSTLTLGDAPANDAVAVATVFADRGYTIFYFCDPTPSEYYAWLDWTLDNVRNEIVVYFSGHGTQVVNRVGKFGDSLSELLVFYDESAKKKTGKIRAAQGLTSGTISEDLVHNLILSKNYPETRIILINDSSHNESLFAYDVPVPSNPPLARGQIPTNVVCVDASVDDRIANQVQVSGKLSSLFTYHLTQLLTTQPKASFQDLYAYMDQNLAEYQDISLIVSQASIVSQPIIAE